MSDELPFTISSRFQECCGNVAAVIYSNCQDFKNNLLCRSPLQNLSKIVRLFCFFITEVTSRLSIFKQKSSGNGNQHGAESEKVIENIFNLNH